LHKYFRMCIVHLFNSSRHSELEELIKNLEAEKAAKDEELAALIKSNEVKLQDLNEQFRRQITEQINRSNELHTKIAVQVSNVLKLSVLQTIWCSLSML
jgi:flagellar basal body L-ring protein FlgH